ncbi:MAG: hypothetical protein ABIR57_13390, partial [Aeromicrobium sp.]
MTNSALTSRAQLLAKSRKHFAAFAASGALLTGGLTACAAQGEASSSSDNSTTNTDSDSTGTTDDDSNSSSTGVTS